MENPVASIAGGLMAAAVPGTGPHPPEGDTLPTSATLGDTQAQPRAQFLLHKCVAE